jgi:hypothetical protein
MRHPAGKNMRSPLRGGFFLPGVWGEMVCVLLAGDAEAREEYMQAVRTRALKRTSTFRNRTHSEPRFRALLLSGEPSGVQLALG